MNQKDNCIIISHVDKYYGKKQALKDVSLNIEQGMFGLLGRNGAGKTTLMKTLVTLHEKQAGRYPCAAFPSVMPERFAASPDICPRIFPCIPI